MSDPFLQSKITNQEETTQNRLMAEITALRQQLVNLEEQLTDSTSVNVTDPGWVESDKNTSSLAGWQSVAEMVPEAIIAVNGEGRIALANRQALSLFGYTAQELMGEKIELLIPQRLQQKHTKLRGKYLAQPQLRPMNSRGWLVGRRKDGVEIPLLIGLSFTDIQPAGEEIVPAGNGDLLVIAMIMEISKPEAQPTDHEFPANILITTKLQAPRLTSDFIPRPRLFNRFDRQRRLILVAAPAGYGKSTLLSSWLETLDYPTMWLSLDENDSDLAVFISYFIAAIQTRFPNIGEHTLSLLNAAELPPLLVLATSLINELNKIEQAYVFVLDDYHLIQEKNIHHLIANILLHAPQTLQLVLASRIDPSLPLASLRARSQMIEIRANDLRFNKRETAGLIEKLLGTSVDPATAASLEERAEGWVTGLRLAVLAREYLGNLKTSLDETHIDNRFVTEYLMSSVFSQQRADVQQWLLKLAVLDRFSPELCEAVCLVDSEQESPQLDGESFVALVSKANLFIIPLDQHQEWFRFHHLFQHFLQIELEKQCTSAEIRTLHARASKWLENQGLLEEAFQHALSSGHELMAAQLIERTRIFLLNNDQWPTIDRWLARLPEDIVQQRTGLLLARAWIYFYQFALEAIPPLLIKIETTMAAEPDAPVLQAEVNFFWGHHWYWLGESQRSLDQLTASLERLPVSYHQGRAEAVIFHALARYSLGQKEAVIQELRKSLHYDRLPRSIHFRQFGALIFIHILSGESNKALQVTFQMMDFITWSGGTAYIETWIPYLQALVHYGLNHLQAANEGFVKLVENRYFIHTRAAIDGLAGLALTYQIQQQVDKANSAMSQLLNFALQLKDPSYASIARSFQARLWLLQGDLESAVRWQEKAELAFDIGLMFYWLEVPRITRCRVLIAKGTPAALNTAIELLTTYLQENQEQHNILREIEISVLLAAAYAKQGQLENALAILEQVVILSRPGIIIQPFIEVGPELVGLLTPLLQQDFATDYLHQILEAIQLTSGGSPAPSITSSDNSIDPRYLGEQLTRREREVLGLIAQDLTNQEIATTLTISIHTVKRHTSNIYRKLGVQNRRQATTKAKVMGLTRSD